MSTAAPAGAQAVTRALRILDCFHDSGPTLSASDLSRRTGLSVSTAHRLARTLVSAGFLEQATGDSRYRLGPSLTELGQLSYHQRGLHHAAPEVAALSARTGVTADLAVRNGGHAVILVGDSLGPSGVGLRRPLHSTSLGKALLAWRHPSDGGPGSLESPQRFTARTLTEPADLEAELDRVRKAGHAVNDGESMLGVRSLAVPVLDREHVARFALALRSTPEIITDDRRGWFLSRLHDCARTLQILMLPPEDRPEPE
ncbi:IclR family transcriptional regulator [Streptomyces sp. NBC_01089]|uniref:IclR family transcriptional regulator n=1 Tax=Streptomyces sp. NBC_01089 TaxID=2903747 RepID=UPI003870C3E8|nr:IclR family transcriptional regulator [Streptomyces sp. NBC_01089]